LIRKLKGKTTWKTEAYVGYTAVDIKHMWDTLQWMLNRWDGGAKNGLIWVKIRKSGRLF
jgi:hypothetical protein